MTKQQRDWHRRKFYFLGPPAKTEPDYQKLRIRGKKELNPQAQLKLEWIIFYRTQGKRNATLTAAHFGITRKSIHKWLKRYKEHGLLGLEETSRAPIHVRKRMISFEQRLKVRALRKRYPKYGKMKLVYLYSKQYQESISSWKIQKVIEEDSLYPDKPKALKLRRKQVQARIHQRQRITKFVKENKVGNLWHVDTVVLTLSSGGYRYLLTAIDEVSKLAFARLYTTHTSRNAKDFLERLVYLTDNRVINLHTDNGSEFKKEFEEACRVLTIPQWYSRPHTPKDNSVLERFNRTIQEEFIAMSEADILFVPEFNSALTDWLIEYNSVRPHKTLAYLSPLDYLDNYYSAQGELSPMYSSLTTA